ncbi:MAG: hypothetical protein HUU29_12510, partial [Planctomycetaceae bacterium]|nr:hypothetical protein [Planctomycetaceae bacterium]
PCTTPSPDQGQKPVAGDSVATKTSSGKALSGEAFEALIDDEKAAAREVFDLCLFGIDAMRKKFKDDPMALLRATDMRVIREARSAAANDDEAESLDKLLLKLLRENNRRAKARLTMVAGALLTNADVQSATLVQRICRERIKRFEARGQAQGQAEAVASQSANPAVAQGSPATPVPNGAPVAAVNSQAKVAANGEKASELVKLTGAAAVASAIASSGELALAEVLKGIASGTHPDVSLADLADLPDLAAMIDALPANAPALVGA